MTWSWLDQRPIIVAIAGPNGAGKTTFYHAHIAPAGLRFLNADHLAAHLSVDAYQAAAIADRIRTELVSQRESFCFETVLSDPVGAKVDFLKSAASNGYHVVLCFIGLSDARQSDQRVAMRVTQGGHDVPVDKIRSRFPRTLANLKLATRQLPHVIVFDNNDLSIPYRLVAEFKNGECVQRSKKQPKWLIPMI